jgi:hypothetical protein
MLKKFGFGRDAAASKSAPVAAPDAGDAERLLVKLRELVRVAVKGSLNKHGMGATWVGCAVDFAPGLGATGEVTGVLAIRLIVQEWREDLLRYLPALQKKIIEAMARAEPGMDHSRHVVSWEFAPDCGCPVTDLPPSDAWAAKAPAVHQVGTSKTAQPAKPRFDLPPSDFDKTRDERDDIPSIFAATQPGFLATEPGTLPKPKK